MSHDLWMLILGSFGETMAMVMLSTLLAAVFGIPLGVLLFVVRGGGMVEHRLLSRSLQTVVNGLRSIPFVILMVLLMPLTRMLVGTSIGTLAAIVPLSIAAIPLVARLVESAFGEVPKGLVEVGQSLGASPLHIVTKILLPESWPRLVQGLTVTGVSLVGYSAMAGAVGGGGLGDVAIRYGYQRVEPWVMGITVCLLVLLVQALQALGDRCARQCDRR